MTVEDILKLDKRGLLIRELQITEELRDEAYSHAIWIGQNSLSLYAEQG